MLLIKQNIIKKRWVNGNIIELDTGNNKIYKIDAICNNTVYARESKLSYLLEYYYLIFWKDYLKKKNILEPVLAI